MMISWHLAIFIGIELYLTFKFREENDGSSFNFIPLFIVILMFIIFVIYGGIFWW